MSDNGHDRWSCSGAESIGADGAEFEVVASHLNFEHPLLAPRGEEVLLPPAYLVDGLANDCRVCPVPSFELPCLPSLALSLCLRVRVIRYYLRITVVVSVGIL